MTPFVRMCQTIAEFDFGSRVYTLKCLQINVRQSLTTNVKASMQNESEKYPVGLIFTWYKITSESSGHKIHTFTLLGQREIRYVMWDNNTQHPHYCTVLRYCNSILKAFSNTLHLKMYNNNKTIVKTYKCSIFSRLPLQINQSFGWTNSGLTRF